MTNKPTSASKKRRGSSRTATSLDSHVELEHIRLIGIDFSSSPDLLFETGDLKFSCNCTIFQYLTYENKAAVLVSCGIKSEKEEKEIYGVEVQYFFVFKTEKSVKKKDAEDIVRLSIWPIFSTLAKKIAADAYVDILDFPLHVERLTWDLDPVDTQK